MNVRGLFGFVGLWLVVGVVHAARGSFRVVRQVEVSGGGMYGMGEGGVYRQVYLRGEAGVGFAFFPVVVGVRSGGFPSGGQVPYEVWISICGECYRRWLRKHTEALLGGKARVQRYYLLANEYRRLDSLVGLVDTSELKARIEALLAEGDSVGADSVRRVYERSQLLYRRYAYVKGVYERFAMDTGLLRVKDDYMAVGRLLRSRGSLPDVTGVVERVNLFRVGRFGPGVVPAELMYPVWVEGMEGSFLVGRNLVLQGYGGRVLALSYGMDSAVNYWSGSLGVEIANTYRLGGYVLSGEKERQYVVYGGVRGVVGLLRYTFNVYGMRYVRVGNSYLLIQEGVLDSVLGRWRGRGYGGWGEVVYRVGRHTLLAGGKYYGGIHLRVLPYLPAQLGMWYAGYGYGGKGLRVRGRLGRLFLESGGLWNADVQLSGGLGRHFVRVVARGYIGDSLGGSTYIARVMWRFTGLVSPSLYIQYQRHTDRMDVYLGGGSLRFGMGRVRHRVHFYYQRVDVRFPREVVGGVGAVREERYGLRYGFGWVFKGFVAGPYGWYLRGGQEHLVGGLEVRVSGVWGGSCHLWMGGGFFRNLDESGKRLRLDSGIRIHWKWE